MRIIGGKLSGKKIEAPEGKTTRPMLDRIREALFNIIEHHEWGKGLRHPVIDATVIDAFCGTGALAFESLSRGAKYATAFENDAAAIAIAGKNAQSLGVQEKFQLIVADALMPPKAKHECRIAFLAPPYRKGLIAPCLRALDEKGWIAKNALIVAETAKKEELQIPEKFQVTFSRSYADTALHFVLRR